MAEIPAPLTLDEGKAVADFEYLLDTFRDVLVDFGGGRGGRCPAMG